MADKNDPEVSERALELSTLSAQEYIERKQIEVQNDKGEYELIPTRNIGLLGFEKIPPTQHLGPHYRAHIGPTDTETEARYRILRRVYHQADSEKIEIVVNGFKEDSVLFMEMGNLSSIYLHYKKPPQLNLELPVQESSKSLDEIILFRGNLEHLNRTLSQNPTRNPFVIADPCLPYFCSEFHWGKSNQERIKKVHEEIRAKGYDGLTDVRVLISANDDRINHTLPGAGLNIAVEGTPILKSKKA